MPRYLAFLSFAVILSVVVLASGCSGKKKKTAADNMGMGDTEIIDPIDGDVPMGGRFEVGALVTDASFENVVFGYNQYDVGGSEIAKIDAVAQFMNQNADVTLVAEGNCDERGSREYNVALGENRAQAVRAYLISLGVGGDRIQTRSYGEENPLDAGHSESAWAANRRVEFKLYR